MEKQEGFGIKESFIIFVGGMQHHIQRMFQCSDLFQHHQCHLVSAPISTGIHVASNIIQLCCNDCGQGHQRNKHHRTNQCPRELWSSKSSQASFLQWRKNGYGNLTFIVAETAETRIEGAFFFKWMQTTGNNNTPRLSPTSSANQDLWGKFHVL